MACQAGVWLHIIETSELVGTFQSEFKEEPSNLLLHDFYVTGAGIYLTFDSYNNKAGSDFASLETTKQLDGRTETCFTLW